MPLSNDDVFAELSSILSERDYVSQIENHEVRSRLARELLVQSLSFISSVLGDSIVGDAYGRLGDGDRSAALGLLAMRTNMVSFLFANMEDDSADLNHVTAEALAVMRGDTPQLFDRLPVRKTKYRLHSAKLNALKWDAWLDGMALKAGRRHDLVSEAFSETWDVITDWRGPIAKLFGAGRLNEHLRVERHDGARGLLPLRVREGETWEDALRRDGLAYRQALRANA